MVKITATILKDKQNEVHEEFIKAVKNIWDFCAKKEHENDVKVTMKAEILYDKALPEVYKQLAELDGIKSINIQEILN